VIGLMACDGNGDITDSSSAGVTKIFYTVSSYNGNLGGVSGADSKCMADSNYPGSGTYKALIVDGTNRIASASANAGDGQVDWVLQPNTTYYRSDGSTIILTTDSNGIFVFGTLDNSFGSGGRLWMGLNADWTTDNHCTTWADGTNSYPAVSGSGGDSVETSSSSIDASIAGSPYPCNFSGQLLCVEQ